MNASSTQPIAERGLTLDLARYPGMNHFSLELARGAEAPRRFLCGSRGSSGEKRSAALVAALAATNLAWGNDVSEELRVWGEGTSETLIAGQQVGFAGGPLYTLAKVASLLRLRRDLAASGTQATLFFWLATEDHDFDEVSQVTLWTRDGVERLRAVERPRASYPVGGLKLPASLRRAYAKWSGEDPDWLDENLNFRDSFALLLTEALRGQKVVLVDAMLPALRREGKPLFLQIFDRYEQIQSALRQRSADVIAGGYTLQIAAHDDGDFGLLYRIAENGERLPIRKQGTSWKVGDQPLEAEALRALIEEHPESISTSALLRPLLQDAVFDSSIFIGGPAEVAYYAQVTAMHALTGVREPQVMLRGHALVAPRKYLAAFDRYPVDPERLFAGAEALLAPLETSRVSEAESIIAGAVTAVDTSIRQLDALLGETDRAARRPLHRTATRLHFHLLRLRERTTRAIVRRESDRYQAILRMSDLLVPRGVPQDREIAWLSFWRMYGPHLLERLIDEIEPGRPVLKVVAL